MTETSTALVPGISAAEHDHLVLGAREFFARQDPGVLVELIRCAGADPLSGDLYALTAPADPPRPPARAQYRQQAPDDPYFLGPAT